MRLGFLVYAHRMPPGRGIRCEHGARGQTRASAGGSVACSARHYAAHRSPPKEPHLALFHDYRIRCPQRYVFFFAVRGLFLVLLHQLERHRDTGH